MNKHPLFFERGPAFWWTGLTALVASGTIFILFVSLVLESIPVFKSHGISFLWGTDWFAGEVYGGVADAGRAADDANRLAAIVERSVDHILPPVQTDIGRSGQDGLQPK